ncbi:MAG: hypothetical protein R3C03_17595 [Pirellulaceae bacterium]
MTRLIPAGSVIKLCLINGQTHGFDDHGTFLIGRSDVVPLSRDLENCIDQLRTDDEFTKEFARGNYFANINLEKAKTHFARAIEIRPNDQYVMLEFALANDYVPERTHLLEALVESGDSEVLELSRLHLAILQQDLETLATIVENEYCSLLSIHEYWTSLLRTQPENLSAIIEKISKRAEAYGEHPRTRTLNAMTLQVESLSPIPMEKRAEKILFHTQRALQVDPWFYFCHVTAGEYLLTVKRYQESVHEFEHALVLNPFCLHALYKLNRISETVLGGAIESRIMSKFDTSKIYDHLATLKDFELPEDQPMERKIHGYYPVNHGGDRMQIFELLKLFYYDETIRYLEYMGVAK